MGTNLRRPTRNHSLLFNNTLSLQNALHPNFATGERGTRSRGGLLQKHQEIGVLDGSSMPLSGLLYSSLEYTFPSPHFQIPCILSHPTSLQQNNLLGKNNCRPIFSSREFSVFCNFGFPPKYLGFNFRSICSFGYEGCSDNDDEVGESSTGSINLEVNVQEVERVCKVIEELFALDRNMEAVLDECGIRLSHGLVLNVLERFKHARKPAFRFFCWAGNQGGYAHDSSTYNSMMTILGKTRQFETMVTLLEEMGEKGLLTIETFQIAIKAFAASRERRKAVGVFELMQKYKFKVEVGTVNCLLDALGRANLGKEAQILFGRLEERFTPNLQTYTVLLNGWCKVKNLLEAGRVWNEMIDKGLKPDVVAHNTMLEGLLKCKKGSDAIKLFDIMKVKSPAPNVRSYTILIRYLCKQKKMDEAVQYFEEMLDYGYQPDAAVYTCLVTGFGNMKKMDKVFGLLKEMKEKGCPPDGQMYNALIKLMRNRKMPDDAVRVYKKMVQNGIQPTIHTYNMMMKSFFQLQNFDMGYAVWEEMNLKGCCPDDNSYIILIGGLISQGSSVEACKYLEEMIEKGMKAPQLDYNKFAADFSRAGKPHVLKELAQKMKFSGKFEASTFFSRCAEMTTGREKSTDF